MGTITTLTPQPISPLLRIRLTTIVEQQRFKLKTAMRGSCPFALHRATPEYDLICCTVLTKYQIPEYEKIWRAFDEEEHGPTQHTVLTFLQPDVTMTL